MHISVHINVIRIFPQFYHPSNDAWLKLSLPIFSKTEQFTEVNRQETKGSAFGNKQGYIGMLRS